MEGGVPKGLHHHGRPTLKGEESQVDSPKGAGHPPTWKGGIPPQVGFPPWVGFPITWKVLGSGLIRRLVVQHLGFHLYNEGHRGGGRPPQSHKLAAPHRGRPPLSQTLAAPLLLHLSRTLSEAPPEFSITTATTPSCCRIQGGATTTTRKVLIDNVSKSSAKGYFSSPMGLTRRYGFCCGNCVRQSPTTIFSVRRAWAPFRHGKSDRCPSVSGSPLTADVMQTDTWQTPLTGS